MRIRAMILPLLAGLLLGLSISTACQGDEPSDWGLIAIGEPTLGSSWFQDFLIQWSPTLPAFNHVQFQMIGAVAAFESPGLTNLSSPWVLGVDTATQLTADGPNRNTLNLRLNFNATPPTQNFEFNWSLWNNGVLKWTKDRTWRFDSGQNKWRFTESVDPQSNPGYVPEPFSMVLGSLGLGVVAGVRRLRAR